MGKYFSSNGLIVIKTESKGQSWIQRNWRPITMLTFLVLVVLDSLGLLAYRLANEAWTLLTRGFIWAVR